MERDVRVYMYMDVTIDVDGDDNDAVMAEAKDTVQRILEEGEPFVGDGGIEVYQVDTIEE